MAFRGVQVSYETIRRWCEHFGASYATRLKRRRPKLGDKWFLDEVFLKINGVQHYLWRAVDQHGAVIDILVQPTRDRFAAMRSFDALGNQSSSASRDRDRQASQLWRCEETNPATSNSPTEPVP